MSGFRPDCGQRPDFGQNPDTQTPGDLAPIIASMTSIATYR